jgi:hypothetical protein
VTTFGAYVHTIIEQGGHHARKDGSATIEAHRAHRSLGQARAGTRRCKKDLQSAHLLLGILEAGAGTVPRALALAGIDQADLAARVRQALTNEG